MADKQEHPQAKWLRAIADGEVIEWQREDLSWASQDTASVLRSLATMPANNRMRIKPRTITIGKYQVAEPMKVAPDDGTRYWGIQPGNEGGLYSDTWTNCSFEHLRIKAGMCWLKREDAELAAKAITKLLTGKS